MEWCLAIWLFLLPLETVWIFRLAQLNGGAWQYGTMVIYAKEILLWLIFGLAIFIFIKEKKKFNFDLKILKNKKIFWPLVCLIGFLFWSGISFLWSADRGIAIYSWLKLVEVVAFVFLLINISNWRKNFIALSLAGGLQSVLGLWQFASQKVMASKWLGIAGHAVYPLGDAVTESPVGRFLRAYGSLAHPNIFGGFVAIAFFASVFWFQKSKKSWQLIPVFFILLNFVGLFVSFSRSAWLGWLAAFILWFVVNIRVKEKRIEVGKITWITLLLSLILILNFWPILNTRISGSGRLEKKSVDQRIEYLSQSRQVIKNNWLLGVGNSNYTYYLYRQDSSHQVYDYQPVHNLFLLIWSELGVIGLALILILLAFTCWQIWLTKKWEAGILAFVLLPISLVDHYLWTLYVGLIILALVLALAWKKEDKICLDSQ